MLHGLRCGDMLSNKLAKATGMTRIKVPFQSYPHALMRTAVHLAPIPFWQSTMASYFVRLFGSSANKANKQHFVRCIKVSNSVHAWLRQRISGSVCCHVIFMIYEACRGVKKTQKPQLWSILMHHHNSYDKQLRHMHEQQDSSPAVSSYCATKFLSSIYNINWFHRQNATSMWLTK